jgi:hypothetical protein
MDIESLHGAPRSLDWRDGALFALGCLVAPITLIAVPLAALYVGLPVALTTVGKVVYVAASLGCSAWLISAASLAPDRRRRFVNAFMALLLFLSLPAFLFVGCSQLLSHFEVVTETPLVASPNGRLVAVDRYVDSGALGGDSQLLITGRLIPGLLNWQYLIPLDAEPGSVVWVDDATVIADGRRFSIPRVIAATAW